MADRVRNTYIEGKRFAFMEKQSREAGSCWEPGASSNANGQSGMWVSDLLPHLAKVGDDIALMRAVNTDVFNHGPAKFSSTPARRSSGRPSMGAWVTYGIGSESQTCPVSSCCSPGRAGRAAAPLWGSGFLPTTYQGVPFRSGAEPILNLANPPGIDSQRQQGFVAAVNDLNRRGWPRRAIRKSPRASRPTKWRIACRPARRS